jgi:hypothetical protein
MTRCGPEDPERRHLPGASVIVTCVSDRAFDARRSSLSVAVRLALTDHYEQVNKPLTIDQVRSGGRATIMKFEVTASHGACAADPPDA